MGYGIGFNSQGHFTTFPSVFVQFNADNLDMRNTGPTGIVAILGEGTGFLPPKIATPLAFDVGSPSRVLQPSELLTATEFAVRPFAQLDRGAGQVYAVPVTPATPATGTLSSSTPTVLLTLTSQGYGTTFNAIQHKHVAVKTLTIRVPTPTGYLTEAAYVYTTIAGLVAQINARSGLVKATFAAEGTIVDHAYTALAGATSPVATSSDYADGLNALNGTRFNAVSVVSSDPAVWAMLAQYAIDHRLRGFVGSGIKDWNGLAARATSAATLKSEAAGLNAPRMMHIGLGCDEQPGYIFASRYAALAASLDPSVPMTAKSLDAHSIEARLDVQTEVGAVDGLLMAGVAVPVPDPGAPGTYIVSRGLSTWTTDDNLLRREQSVLAAMDGLQDIIEARMRQFLGNEGTQGVIRRAVNVTYKVLDEATRPASIVRIFDFDRKSVHAQFTSDTVLRVFAKVTPIPPINFVSVFVTLERVDIDVAFDINLAA